MRTPHDHDPHGQARGRYYLPLWVAAACGVICGGAPLDECFELCPTCAKTLGTCLASDFMVCDDPNRDDAAEFLSDWRCSCHYPSKGPSGTAGAAGPCNLDECTSAQGMYCPTCGGDATCSAAGQSCDEGLYSPDATGDWVCRCVPPYAGAAEKGAVATCVLDECSSPRSTSCLSCAGSTCEDVGQACEDKHPATYNWRCLCVPPQAGLAGVAGTGACTLDECTTDGCATCANDTCASGTQTCDEPDESPTSLSDWTCTCPSPSVGTATGGAAECVLDECTAVCGTCAVTAPGLVAVCVFAGGQVCEDPDPAPESTLDWMCVCLPPSTGVPGVMAHAASCTLDECELVCDTCEEGVCERAGQDCVDADTDPSRRTDWQCRCIAPEEGAARIAAAECTLDECNADCPTCAGTTCMVAGQRCREDRDGAEDLRDWRCQCKPPSVGYSKVGAAADCELNECTLECDTCAEETCSALGQQCEDPDHDPLSLSDWMCQCAPPTVGADARAAPAACVMDECIEACPTCAGTSCSTVAQVCIEGDANASVTGDWMCTCVEPLVGAATAAPAACTLHECTAACDTCAGTNCSDAGQLCSDPDTRPTSVKDWECACVAPSTGQSVAAPAACVLDECAATCASCAGATCDAQLCEDTNTDPTSTDDWECVCAAPYTGRAQGTPAQCILDECTAACGTCVADTCKVAMQDCVDTDTGIQALSTWECRCVLPLTGAATAASAACQLDECTATCSSCANGMCAAASQACDDPDTDPGATEGWLCQCVQPLVGAATARMADCTIDECAAACNTCENGVCVGQTCVEASTSSTSLGDWECVCTPPSVGVATARLATCALDECSASCTTCAGLVCSDAGQGCEDADMAETALGNWECVCPPPEAGRSALAAAACTLDECTEACPTCSGGMCMDAQQLCHDPDLDAAALSSWECRCAPPYEGTAVGAAAVCRLDECTADCRTCATDTCTTAGQTCRDSNVSTSVLQDWECRCAPPFEGSAVTEVAACTIDECTTVCDSCAGTNCSDHAQQCKDRNHAATALWDWECWCTQPLGGAEVAAPAVCRLDECLTNHTLCTSCAHGACDAVGQDCVEGSDAPTMVADWECRCRPPSVGTPTQAGAATCHLDECTEVCPTCAEGMCAHAGQACEDGDPAMLRDWRCVCAAPATGRALGAVADCVLDECMHTCATCANGMCAAGGQDCEDLDRAALNSWRCWCRAPAAGSKVAGTAACVLDECTATCATCANTTCKDASQLCDDPAPMDESTGDWTCSCSGTTQTAVAAPAPCPLDECRAVCPTCAMATCGNAGQTCVDPAPIVTSVRDWECSCPPPLDNVLAVAAAAVCVWDECAEGAGAVCTAAGQACVDPTLTAGRLDDWRCECERPSVGQATMAAAECTLPSVAPSVTVVRPPMLEPGHDPGAADKSLGPGGEGESDGGAGNTSLTAEAPRTPVPAIAQQDTVEVIGGVAAVASVAGAAAGPALRLVASSGACRESGAPHAYPRALHPLQWTVAGSAAFGVLVGNYLLMAACAVAGYAVWQIANAGGKAVAPAFFARLDAQGFTRFPSAPLFVYQFLYQGLAMASIDLILQPPGTWLLLAGCVSFVACWGVPFCILRVIRSGVPDKARYRIDPETEDCAFKVVLLGPGEWVSTSRSNHFVQRWASVMRQFREACASWAFLDFAASMAVAGAQSAAVDTMFGCGHVKVACLIVFLASTAVEAAVCPDHRLRNSYFDATVGVCQVLSMGFLAAGYYAEDYEHWGFDAAGNTVLLAMIFLMARIALDALAELYVLISGRRTRLQGAEFAVSDAKDDPEPCGAVSLDVLDESALWEQEKRKLQPPAAKFDFEEVVSDASDVEVTPSPSPLLAPPRSAPDMRLLRLPSRVPQISYPTGKGPPTPRAGAEVQMKRLSLAVRQDGRGAGAPVTPTSSTGGDGLDAGRSVRASGAGRGRGDLSPARPSPGTRLYLHRSRGDDVVPAPRAPASNGSVDSPHNSVPASSFGRGSLTPKLGHHDKASFRLAALRAAVAEQTAI